MDEELKNCMRYAIKTTFSKEKIHLSVFLLINIQSITFLYSLLLMIEMNV